MFNGCSSQYIKYMRRLVHHDVMSVTLHTPNKILCLELQNTLENTVATAAQQCAKNA